MRFFCDRPHKKGLAGHPQPVLGIKDAPPNPTPYRGHQQQASLPGVAPISACYPTGFVNLHFG